MTSFSRTARACVAVLSLLLSASSLGAATHLITVGDNFFNPSSKTIAAGDTVTWTNSGFAVHNVTSIGPAFFTSSPNFNRGSTYSFTFFAGGTFDYTCTIHLNQNGAIVVTNPPPNVPPTVSITAPINGMKLPAGSTATITTTAQDTDGTVARVEFYERGTNFIGVISNAPFNLPTTNITAGNYALSARVFDNLGASNNSATVNIQVLTNATLVVDATLANQPAFRVGNAIVGQSYFIDALTNLGSGAFGPRWFPISTNVAGSTNFVFNDTVLTNLFPRLYRVRQEF